MGENNCKFRLNIFWKKNWVILADKTAETDKLRSPAQRDMDFGSLKTCLEGKNENCCLTLVFFDKVGGSTGLKSKGFVDRVGGSRWRCWPGPWWRPQRPRGPRWSRHIVTNLVHVLFSQNPAKNKMTLDFVVFSFFQNRDETASPRKHY